MSDNKKNVATPEKRTEGQIHVVISVPLIKEVLEYLGKQPRVEVNNLCIALESAPTLDGFNKQVKDYYKANPDSLSDKI